MSMKARAAADTGRVGVTSDTTNCGWGRTCRSTRRRGSGRVDGLTKANPKPERTSSDRSKLHSQPPYVMPWIDDRDRMFSLDSITKLPEA
jgi:hypothetical protein